MRFVVEMLIAECCVGNLRRKVRKNVRKNAQFVGIVQYVLMLMWLRSTEHNWNDQCAKLEQICGPTFLMRKWIGGNAVSFKTPAAPSEFLFLVTGEIVEKNRDKIWIATQDPIMKSVRCETYAVYLMYTTYQTNEVLKPQGYHLIEGPVLENSHALEIIELPQLDWETSLAALNAKYPVPHVTGTTLEGQDETETETESDQSIVCVQFL